MAKLHFRISSKECGFTLLELLVSIVILSLIVTISYSALRVGSRSWQSTAKIISKNSASRFAEQFIRKKIEQIYPLYWSDNQKKSIAFQGDEEGLKFIAPAPQGRETVEYYEYYIAKERLEDGSLSLLLYFEPHDPSNKGFKVARNSPHRKILTQLETVKYLYYGVTENSRSFEWNDVWEDTSSTYPSMVKIEITSQGSMEPSLDIAVEPRSKINMQNTTP
jgi:general secretion pathway protein J